MGWLLLLRACLGQLSIQLPKWPAKFFCRRLITILLPTYVKYGGANEITNGLEGAILSQGKTVLRLAEQSHVIRLSESWLARPLVALWLHILKQQVISCSLPFSVPRRWLLTVITSLSLANRSSSPHACLSCRQRWKQTRRRWKRDDGVKWPKD